MKQPRGRREQVNAKISTYMHINILDGMERSEVRVYVFVEKAKHLTSSALAIINSITTTNADDYIFFQHLYCRTHCAVCVCIERSSYCGSRHDNLLLRIITLPNTRLQEIIYAMQRKIVFCTQSRCSALRTHMHAHI